MDLNNTEMSLISIRIGFWSALLFTAAGVLYALGVGVFFALYPMPSWTDIQAYASFMSLAPQKLFSLCQITAFFSGPLFILLLCSIYDFAPDEKKILARIGICFGIAFVVLSSMTYFVQFTIVPQSILSGQLYGLDQFVQLNTKSFISAMVILGWGLFLGLSSLFISPVFSNSNVERVIRWSFVVTGLFCILNTIGFMLQNIMLALASTLIFDMSLIVACISLCILFKKIEKLTKHMHNC